MGIILLIISLVLVYLKIVSFSEFVAFLPTVFGLLYVQDTVLKVNPRTNDDFAKYMEET